MSSSYNSRMCTCGHAKLWAGRDCPGMQAAQVDSRPAEQAGPAGSRDAPAGWTGLWVCCICDVTCDCRGGG
jgi:hypothetical protein